MGVNYFDQYSLLHFATGIVAYFFGITLYNWIIIHILFEYIENTEKGMQIINTYFKNIWPGGKDVKDSFNNSIIGDNISAIIGWCVAYYIDYIGEKNRWYNRHIK
jgi:hypothetical protein